MATEPHTLDAFTAHVDRLFVKPDDQIGLLLHAAVGVAGEAGELLDAIKKSWIYGKELDRENLLEEAGDTLFYVTALLIHSGFTLEAAMAHNVAKLSKRYPQGYTEVEAGKFYQRRDGKVVGPAKLYSLKRESPYRWDIGFWTYTDCGRTDLREYTSRDLIREVPPPTKRDDAGVGKCDS